MAGSSILFSSFFETYDLSFGTMGMVMSPETTPIPKAVGKAI